MDNIMNIIQLEIFDEREFELDREYLLQMYPANARMIMVMVEEECDKLEYEGSPMLIQYPDKETMLGIARRIYEKVSYKEDAELKNMIEVLVCNEYQIRRCRYKRRRRLF